MGNRKKTTSDVNKAILKNILDNIGGGMTTAAYLVSSDGKAENVVKPSAVPGA